MTYPKTVIFYVVNISRHQNVTCFILIFAVEKYGEELLSDLCVR